MGNTILGVAQWLQQIEASSNQFIGPTARRREACRVRMPLTCQQAAESIVLAFVQFMYLDTNICSRFIGSFAVDSGFQGHFGEMCARTGA